MKAFLGTTSRTRTRLLALVVICLVVATSGCDWANVGGPW
jgi:hypothetical protein